MLSEAFDRMWPAGELARRWSAGRNPGRDADDEHGRLEAAVLARDAETAAALLARHVSVTVLGLESA